MRRYTILHAPLLSFYSRSLYGDVARNWRGSGLLYLLLLLAACWVPLVMKLHLAAVRPLTRLARPLAEKLPAITIQDGVASVEEAQPYLIHDPASGKTAAIIDTTGQFTSLDDTAAGVLLTRTRLLMKGDGEVSTVELAKVPNFYIDGPIAAKWLDWAARWLALTVYPFALLFSFIYRMLQALIYAAVGLAFAAMIKGELTYQASMRLAIIAVTPAILLNTVVLLAGLSIPLWWPICFVITMVYLYLGVKATFEPTGGGVPASPDIPSFSDQ